MEKFKQELKARNTTICERFVQKELQNSPLLVFKQREEKARLESARLKTLEQELLDEKKKLNMKTSFQNGIVKQIITMENKLSKTNLDNLMNNTLFKNIDNIIDLRTTKNVRRHIQDSMSKDTKYLEDKIEKQR